ncbi:replication protein [Geobacillus stearothermophilus]|uniref:replication protein n=1 Tax=Geobacillus stearothermophilus TaxID=1422 RepID=UPI002E1BDBDA|nr:replication protein [Geobacillus stearothermophilus]MED3740139.1 replication protein [Geobacillus stearothermophilus]MED3765994.1 replication protein [Geobacillus stearothermophilus]MED3773705.1 replication protein [Geobacillus stearothermophilus]
MADVQLEHGYTKIANEILERMALTKLSPTQFRLIFVIWRYTYGFNRKDHEMSLSFLAEATGVHKQRVKQELDKLIESNIIIVTEEGTFSKSRKLAFNKDYDTWRLQSTKESTVSEIAYTTVSKNADTTVSEIADTTVSEFAYQEIKNINKNLKKNNDDDDIGDDNMAHDAFRLIADKYIQRREKGLSLSPKDEAAIEKLLQEQIPLDGVLKLIDEVFDEYQPKFNGDEIHSFEYVRKVLLSKYHEQKEGEGTDGGTIRKHRRGISRPSAEGGKTYEQILREAEAARRAWGWKG